MDFTQWLIDEKDLALKVPMMFRQGVKKVKKY